MFQIEATVYPLSLERQLAIDAALALIAGPEETWVTAPGPDLLGAISSRLHESSGPVHVATNSVAPGDTAVQALVAAGAEVFIVTDSIGLDVATAGGRVAYDALDTLICTRSGELALAIRERFAAATEGLQPVPVAEPAPTPEPVPSVPTPATPAAAQQPSADPLNATGTTAPPPPTTTVTTDASGTPPPAPPAVPDPPVPPAAPVAPEAPVVEPPVAPANLLDIPDASPVPPVAPEQPLPPAGETASWSGEAGGPTPA